MDLDYWGSQCPVSFDPIAFEVLADANGQPGEVLNTGTTGFGRLDLNGISNQAVHLVEIVPEEFDVQAVFCFEAAGDSDLALTAAEWVPRESAFEAGVERVGVAFDLSGATRIWCHFFNVSALPDAEDAPVSTYWTDPEEDSDGSSDPADTGWDLRFQVFACPFGVESGLSAAADWIAVCDQQLSDIWFGVEVFDENGIFRAGGTSYSLADGTVEFGPFVPGQATVVENVPEGYAEPVVFCGDDPDPEPLPIAALEPSVIGSAGLPNQPAGFTEEIHAGRRLLCVWFNLPLDEMPPAPPPVEDTEVVAEEGSAGNAGTIVFADDEATEGGLIDGSATHASVIMRGLECPTDMDLEVTDRAYWAAACVKPLPALQFWLEVNFDPATHVVFGTAVDGVAVAEAVVPGSGFVVGEAQDGHELPVVFCDGDQSSMALGYWTGPSGEWVDSLGFSAEFVAGQTLDCTWYHPLQGLPDLEEVDPGDVLGTVEPDVVVEVDQSGSQIQPIDTAVTPTPTPASIDPEADGEDDQAGGEFVFGTVPAMVENAGGSKAETLTANAWACPYGLDRLIADYESWRRSCVEPVDGVTFSVGQAGASVTDEDVTVSGTTGLGLPPDGDVELVEQVPAGYGTPVVFCGGSGPIESSQPGLLMLAPPGVELAGVVLDSKSLGDLSCDWFNLPAPATVSISTSVCPPEVDLSFIDQTDKFLVLLACQEPIDGVTFEVTPGGPDAESLVVTTGAPDASGIATPGGAMLTEVTPGEVRIVPIGTDPATTVVFCYEGSAEVAQAAQGSLSPQIQDELGGVTQTLDPGAALTCAWLLSVPEAEIQTDQGIDPVNGSDATDPTPESESA
jgi:hypothetical protein